MRLSIYLLAACLTFAGLGRISDETEIAATREVQDQLNGTDRPFLALWRQFDGPIRGSQTPFLRFAIWADGRVLYAKDPAKWGHELRRGKIAASRVRRLKAALGDSGIFELKHTCYLALDAPMDCLMVDLGDMKQMLYWNELEKPGYEINAIPKPVHLEFKRIWKAVNHLGLVALPDEGETVKERFRVPESWYLKRAIQSE
jgi:hypothetical protein